MTENETLRFASSAWWAEHPDQPRDRARDSFATPVMTDTAEEIWLSPTTDEWRKLLNSPRTAAMRAIWR